MYFLEYGPHFGSNFLLFSLISALLSVFIFFVTMREFSNLFLYYLYINLCFCHFAVFIIAILLFYGYIVHLFCCFICYFSVFLLSKMRSLIFRFFDRISFFCYSQFSFLLFLFHAEPFSAKLFFKNRPSISEILQKSGVFLPDPQIRQKHTAAGPDVIPRPVESVSPQSPRNSRPYSELS